MQFVEFIANVLLAIYILAAALSQVFKIAHSLIFEAAVKDEAVRFSATSKAPPPIPTKSADEGLEWGVYYPTPQTFETVRRS